MNKRTALVVASGLVVALAAAGFGIVLGFAGPDSAHGKVAVHRNRKPVVKTVTDHETIHKPAPSTNGGGVTTTVSTRTPAPTTDRSVTSDASDDTTTTQHTSPESESEPSDTVEHESESPSPTWSSEPDDD